MNHDENQLKLLVSLKLNLQYTCMAFDAFMASLSVEDADAFNGLYTELVEKIASEAEKNDETLAETEKND